MEVSRLLPIELTTNRAAILSGTESLEAIIDQLGILFMEVFVGHDIRGAGVHLATTHLQSSDKAGPSEKQTNKHLGPQQTCDRHSCSLQE